MLHKHWSVCGSLRSTVSSSVGLKLAYGPLWLVVPVIGLRDPTGQTYTSTFDTDNCKAILFFFVGQTEIT